MDLGGRKLTAIFSDLADQTNSSVLLKYGETTLLVTAVMGKSDKEMGYFPLVVDYEEKYYASGRILGGRFLKREGRPSDEAILSGRMIDRTIRPLFDQSTRRDVQVIATVLAIDEENDPGTLGIIGASLALATSDIPWNGPASSIRIGRKRGEDTLTLNPSYTEDPDRDLDLLICGKDGNINMIEARALEVKESVIASAFQTALAELAKIEAWQKEIVATVGKPKVVLPKKELSEEARTLFASDIEPKLEVTIFGGLGKNAISELEEVWATLLKEKVPTENQGLAKDFYNHRVDEIVHEEALKNNRRADGRGMTEVRPLFAEAGGISPMLHGTGTFYRGQTHVLSVLTLGGPKDSQLLEGMEVRGKKYFMHHYNFPPFSVGETGRLGGINRRAVGHGALAEKALEATLPSHDEFPYTIRIVSESTASNGSTSMASVCASTLALMDAGVPIKRPTAGIAMGLMLDTRDNSKYKVLTDIQGPEDHHGDMDFKVAGTSEGVTAIQMDVKVDGIPAPILVEALEHAKNARLHILETITAAIPAPRPTVAASAPKVLKMQIKVEEIGGLIGPGGRVIQGLSEETGAEIEIEQDGTVTVVGRNGSAEKARDMIVAMFRVPEAGETHDGKVTRVMDFGIFVEIGAKKEGLVHVSEVAPYRIDSVSKYFKEGDIVPVVVREIDDMGRINLSIKQRDPEFAKNKGIPEFTGELPQRAPGGDRPRFGGHGGGHRGPRR